MRKTRILVVDDFQQFREFICSMLQKRPELQVSEVADGLEAVQQAVKLHPDLILLDIGLPNLNGLEAARQIRKLAPDCKIIFLTQESSHEIAQEAFDLGARGYIVKVRAAGELLGAIDAVLQGQIFVGSRVSSQGFRAVASTVKAELRHQHTFAPTAPSDNQISRRHEVQFYSDDAAFLEGFTRFIKAALEQGNAAIVVATESHRQGLIQRLRTEGVDLDSALEQESYIPLDVGDTLARFMVNGSPDPVSFEEVASSLVLTAATDAGGKRRRVAACGECAPLLWKQGMVDAAIRVEQLWDQISRKYDVDILCGYQLTSFRTEEDRFAFQRICAEHSAVL